MKQIDKAALGARVQKQRKNLNMTVEALAERSGIPAKRLEAIEAGERCPSLAEAVALSHALSIYLTVLACGVR